MSKLLNLIKAGFPYKVAIALITIACIDKSVSMAAVGAVVVLGLMVKDTYEKVKLKEDTKVVLPEETRRLLQDLSSRVTTLEFGVKQRGF